MNKDDHLIFEALVSKVLAEEKTGLVRVKISDYILDEREGTLKKVFSTVAKIKAFDTKSVVYAFVKYIYGKDQHQVKGAYEAVLQDLDVKKSDSKIELTISEFPGDGQKHYVEAKLLGSTGEAEKVGMSGAEYHKARKFGLETAEEEIGEGPVKLVLKHNTAISCSRDGAEQDVKFVKGVIFNCGEFNGSFYTCESDKYGSMAIFPDDVDIISAPEGSTHE